MPTPFIPNTPSDSSLAITVDGNKCYPFSLPGKAFGEGCLVKQSISGKGIVLIRKDGKIVSRRFVDLAIPSSSLTSKNPFLKMNRNESFKTSAYIKLESANTTPRIKTIVLTNVPADFPNKIAYQACASSGSYFDSDSNLYFASQYPVKFRNAGNPFEIGVVVGPYSEFWKLDTCESSCDSLGRKYEPADNTAASCQRYFESAYKSSLTTTNSVGQKPVVFQSLPQQKGMGYFRSSRAAGGNGLNPYRVDQTIIQWEQYDPLKLETSPQVGDLDVRHRICPCR